jgi:ATPase subunit of ABC transporter with duplicated ATPase domains
MRRRMGRPGLVGTMARTAVVAGTATAVSNNVSRRQAGRQQAKADDAQQQQWEQQQEWAAQQAAAAPAAPDSGDMIAQLKDLAALHEQGVLTDAEFAVQKDRLLNG